MCRKSWGFLYRSEIREFSWNISLVQILVEVANISNVRTLKTKVDMGFLDKKKFSIGDKGVCVYDRICINLYSIIL
ncbi:hypothetical protein PFTANZ_02017 [Plasmodium falciparum Tanzania (2000708)]|uniref:Uncharacterized protein n=3 Tax=Plasmodium falciparum TaxID=5833 RepID=A0A024W8N7_PLAFA|nr:hypothetical protein PFFVO_01928 [Plasmodium falciparum Vietnam Oak-Knoll (FVO)]ETW37279.1 hypothetical protein PFTANZ_02017 [Plasmodium falciparum Tanzania (2000708)]ETW49990.1 hypothetical protein PFMALIP_01958 [Plasmodium falciparum MaliPS096_E11]